MRSGLTLVLSLALMGVLLAMNVALHHTRQAAAAAEPERRLTVTTKRLVRNLPPPPAAAVSTNPPAFHWSALESPDYAVYAANLRTVGCPERTLRDILLPDIEKLYSGREEQLEADPADHFWETADQRDARERQLAAQRRALTLEKRALIRQLLGSDWSFAALQELRADGFASAILELLLGFTDLAKTDHVASMHKLFEADAEAEQAATGGIYLDEDIARLHALRDRFEVELARWLEPAEMEELRLRLAAVGHEGMEHLRRQDGVSVTGPELREIARLRADTLDMFAKVIDLEEQLYSEELRAKGEAAFKELLRRFLGEERFADVERAKDERFRALFESTANQGVTKAALVQAFEARRTAESQAEQIKRDAQLTSEERELLLAALRAQTAQTLSRTLGVGGYDAYMKGHGRQFTNSLSVPATRARANPSGAEVIKVK